MLESAELGVRIPKKVDARAEPKLRDALLNAQYDLSQAGRGPVLLLISGVGGGGRGETANKLTEWMDPRHIHVVAFGSRTPEEAARPPAWRHWRAQPPRGKLCIFMNARYNEAMLEHLRSTDEDTLHARFESIREHEQMLTEEGVVLLKFWVHLSRADQKKRLKALDRDRCTSWRVSVAPTAPSVIDNVKLIRDLDLSQKLGSKKYAAALEKAQGKLAKLVDRLKEAL
jgi:polyphosphate kinase 2 (PPK2 family)